MPPRQSTASRPPAASTGNTSEAKEGYCLCKGADDGRPMVSCDNCDNWLGPSLRAYYRCQDTEKTYITRFHFACIGLDEETAAELGE